MTLPTLLLTKLFPPPARPDQVERGRLLARLDGLLRPGLQLGLISAPAGFGKTSLLAGWLTRTGQTAAWLSLDAGENDPGGFLSYLLAAVQRARPGAAAETTALLRAALASAEPPQVTAILASLVNALTALDASPPLLIVLDDFQFIHQREVREGLAFLVEHLPPGVRLVIATRSDPPLPLARLRARGQMVELRAADLRFTQEEAAAFFARAAAPGAAAAFHPVGEPGAGAALNTELVTVLTERTEGWAAGLQMAALAIQSGEYSAPELAQTFSGSHRFVLDYLAEEVLNRLPAETVAFLQRTALLERFNADLCEQIAGDTQAAPAGRFQHLLEDLERANLFLIPIDSERRWYRYHHLFADLLRARLKQIAPSSIPAVHRRAAAWFEQNGWIGEAIQHALAAGEAAGEEDGPDYQQAARLVENHTLALFRRGELHAMQRWVQMLPEPLAARRPRLGLHRAWVLLFAGRVEQTELLLAQIEGQLDGLPGEEQRELRANLAGIRCHRELILGNLDAVLSLGREALEQLPDERSWLYGFVEWCIAYASRMRGDLDTAARLFERWLRHAQAEGDPWGAAMHGNDLGVVRRMQGRLREAVEVFQSALQAVEQAGARRLGYTSRLLTGLAGVLYEQNQLEASQKLLEEAIALNELWRNPNHLVYAWLGMARIHTARRDYPQAEQQLEACQQVLRSWQVVPTLRQAVDASGLMLRLAQGQAPAGEPLETLTQAALSAQPGLPFRETREMQHMLAARLLLAQGRVADALRIIERLAAEARLLGRWMTLIELLVLQALALHRQGQREAALTCLREALERGEPEGALRSFLDNAPLAPGRLEDLLAEVLRHPVDRSPHYLEQLAAALPGPKPGAAPATAPAAQPGSLVEPITSREREVLRLMAEGLTNAQIAARLVISSGTVKAHTANIFRKLDAENRTQAVARARAVGLL